MRINVMEAAPLIVVPKYAVANGTCTTFKNMFLKAGTAKRFPNVGCYMRYMHTERGRVADPDVIEVAYAVEEDSPPKPRRMPIRRRDDIPVPVFAEHDSDDSDDEFVAHDAALEEHVDAHEPPEELTDEQVTKRLWDVIAETNFKRGVDIARGETSFAVTSRQFARCHEQIRAKVCEFVNLMTARIAHIFAMQKTPDSARVRIATNLILRGVTTFDSILDSPDLAIFFIECEYMGSNPLETYMGHGARV